LVPCEAPAVATPAAQLSAYAQSRYHTHRSRSRSRSRDGRKQRRNNSNLPTPPIAARSTSALIAGATAAAAAARPASNSFSMQRTDWRCPACGFSNFRWRSYCKLCSACQPSATAASAERTGGCASSARAAAAAACHDRSSRDDPWSRQSVRDGWETIRWVASATVRSDNI
jgi:hypothetical protein